MSFDLSQFAAIFFEEAAEHLSSMETLLLELDPDAPESEDLNAIFRAAHSIKGGSATFGFSDMAEFTHVLESVLDRVRNGTLPASQELVDVCLAAGDVLRAQLSAHQGSDPADPADAAAVIARLHDVAGEGGAKSAASRSGSAPLGQAKDQGRRLALNYPDAAALPVEALANAAEELSRIGALEVTSMPGGDTWAAILLTEATDADIRELFSWVGDSSRLVIDEQVAEESYGFFEPLPDNAPVSDDAAYGFFEPLPEGSASSAGAAVSAADPGYGFFEPLPAPTAHEANSRKTGAAAAAGLVQPEDGDGYGFFAPVAAPQPEVRVETESPAVTAPAPKAADGAGKKVTSKRDGEKQADTSIRVSVEKVDQLINLVGELVITHAMLAQSASLLDPVVHQSLHNGMAQLERNSRDLQESVMSIRMMPMNFVFSRFPRVVRDLAGRLGKQVELKTFGEATELDKGMIEKLTDPLTHLVRNSLDHGLEQPEDRIAAGKLPTGVITLTAAHQGGHIVIEVADDGRGLNRDRLISKAREKGIPVSDAPTDAEVWNLIFAPGFSTAEQVTDVSGRGVGMDVVKKNIESIGGRVDIDSSPGYGTRTIIHLPLTLAILDGMSVRVGEEMFIIPLTNIVESLQPTRESVKSVSGRGQVVQVREEYLPLVALHEMFSVAPKVTDPCAGILVIVGSGADKMALFVDELNAQHQVVIKSLEANYRRVRGISGATIMGDGKVALILDIPALLRGAASGGLH